MTGGIGTADAYSYNDIIRMQEQAIRRAREMQQKARVATDEAQNDDGDADGTMPEKNEEQAGRENTARRAFQQHSPFSGFLSMLQRLPADDDMIVILPIIMMLLKEEADEKLILALLYIMS